MFKKAVIFSSFFVLFSAPVLTQAVTHYQVTELGFLPGSTGCYARDVNESDQVVGYCTDGASFEAFIWDSMNGLRGLGDLPDGTGNSRALALNNAGQVVGYASTAAGLQAFSWSPPDGPLAALPGGPGSMAWDINDLGVIVGKCAFAASNQACQWGSPTSQPTDIGDIADPMFLEDEAHGINSTGLIVGASLESSPPYIERKAFQFQAPPAMDTLMDLIPDGSSEANAVNDNDVVVGLSGTYDFTHYEAVLWDANGAVVSLVNPIDWPLPSVAWDINNLGQAVGRAWWRGAFLWEDPAGMFFLDELRDESGAFWFLDQAFANNESGKIAGWGKNPAGAVSAFLLTPVDCTPPGQNEICDTVDNDCDGDIDEGYDQDGDLYSSCTGDCNDNDSLIYPGVPEVKHDGIDQDCNGYDLTIDIVQVSYNTKKGQLKVEATSALGAAADLVLEFGCCFSNPMDWHSGQQKWTLTVNTSPDPGFITVTGIEGATSAETGGRLCDPDICDGLDNDCDNAVDEDFDRDDDQVTSCGGDCDDLDPNVNPNVAETCLDGIDNNCDGRIDEGCGGGCNTCHTYPGEPTDPGAHRLSSSHDRHVGRPSDEPAAANKGFDCTRCHNGASHNDAGITGPVEWAAVNVNAHVQVRFDAFNFIAEQGNPVDTTLDSVEYNDVTNVCANLYCHGARLQNSVGSNTTPDWDVPTSTACGTCHDTGLADTTPGTIKSSGNHLTHLTAPFGPLYGAEGCTGCHTAYDLSAGGWHVNQAVEFANVDTTPNPASVMGLGAETADPPVTSTDRCTSCHSAASVGGGIGATMAKDNWRFDNYRLPCLSCHNAADPATANADGTGLTAPAKDGFWNTSGHGLSMAATYSPSGRTGAGAVCADCHDQASAHLDGTAGEDRLTTTGNVLCTGCHNGTADGPGGQSEAQVSTHANTSVTMTYSPQELAFELNCMECHDVHGGANIFMVNSVNPDGSLAAARLLDGITNVTDFIFFRGLVPGSVVFTANTSGSDFATAGVGDKDRICQTCHTATGHYQNNSDTGHFTGVCTSCHAHEFDGDFTAGSQDGFMPAVCVPTENPEVTCDDTVDNDCDGLVDTDDPDCLTPPDCADYGSKDVCNADSNCEWVGSPKNGSCQDAGGGGGCDNDSLCETGEDCTTCPNDCPGQQGGKPADRFCCGDGISQDPELADPALCGGNN